MPELHYDPGLKNTAVCKTAISFLDGEAGRLEYRGYPIEELVEKCTFLEVAYLLIYGELPNASQFTDWQQKVMTHTFVHNRLGKLVESFNYDAHPMGMFIATMAAMSTFHKEANPALEGAELYTNLANEAIVNKQILRILGKTPTIAAACYRHRIGRPLNLPDSSQGYVENFLVMLDGLGKPLKPHPVLIRALDKIFILHAEHEMNCSTAAMRHIASSRVDPYSAIAGATAALYGPLHGGANEAVLRMLMDIRTVDHVLPFLEKYKRMILTHLCRVKRREKKLMGFGHRVYRNMDPRGVAMKRIAAEVFEMCGEDPLLQVAKALEEAALQDEFFTERRLHPNIDFYTGLVYRAMGFPTDYFPLLFVVPRVAGWLAHWREGLRAEGEESKIYRPRAQYMGPPRRSVPDDYKDGESDAHNNLKIVSHPFNKRYLLSSKL